MVMERFRKTILLFALCLCCLGLCACDNADNADNAGITPVPAPSRQSTAQQSVPEANPSQELSADKPTSPTPEEKPVVLEKKQVVQEKKPVVPEEVRDINGTDINDTDMNDTDMNDTNQIKMQIGEAIFTVTLEDNESAQALKEILADGAITVSCSNYGGFEKVCRLGRTLPEADTQITTNAGDVMLYNSNQIVIFYDSNSWAYTRLGKVDAEYIDSLEEILSGEETTITISLNQ